MQPPKASLLGLPTELRLKILQYALQHRSHNNATRPVVFDLSYTLYEHALSIFGWPNRFAVLRTCNQIHEEASEVLHGANEFTIRVMGTRVPVGNFRIRSLGTPADLGGIWRFVSNLRLQIYLEHGEGNKKLVLERTRSFVEVLEYGKHLKRLRIVLTMPEDEGLPSWYEEVFGTLRALRVEGNVSAEFEYDDDDVLADDLQDYEYEICRDLVKEIKGLESG